jgi:hypothetical protein
MKVVKNYSRRPSTRPVKAAEDIDIDDAPVVDEELELEPNDLLLTVEDAAELVGQVASDLAGEEVVVETEIADNAESVDFIVGDETYTAIPEDGDDVVVSAKLLKGKVKITASKKVATRKPATRRPATRRPVKASTAVQASREAMARKRRIAAARAKRMGK